MFKSVILKLLKQRNYLFVLKLLKHFNYFYFDVGTYMDEETFLVLLNKSEKEKMDSNPLYLLLQST